MVAGEMNNSPPPPSSYPPSPSSSSNSLCVYLDLTQMKASNFDSVLLFKIGKFYEMYEMDAYVGVDVLGLIFMKGEQPHAGFPENRYHQMSEALARAGHRVVVVEQVCVCVCDFVCDFV